MVPPTLVVVMVVWRVRQYCSVWGLCRCFLDDLSASNAWMEAPGAVDCGRSRKEGASLWRNAAIGRVALAAGRACSCKSSCLAWSDSGARAATQLATTCRQNGRRASVRLNPLPCMHARARASAFNAERSLPAQCVTAPAARNLRNSQSKGSQRAHSLTASNTHDQSQAVCVTGGRWHQMHITHARRLPVAYSTCRAGVRRCGCQVSRSLIRRA